MTSMIADIVCVANAIVYVSYELVIWFVVNVGRKNVGIWRRINVDDFDVDVEAGTSNFCVNLIRELEDWIPTWKVVPLFEVE